jgi:hypothetical protein
MEIVLGVHQNPLAKRIHPHFINPVMASAANVAVPGSDPAGNVSEGVQYGVLHKRKVCAVKPPPRPGAVENCYRLHPHRSRALVGNADLFPDPMAQEENAPELVPLSRNDLLQFEAFPEFGAARMPEILGRGEDLVDEALRILRLRKNKPRFPRIPALAFAFHRSTIHYVLSLAFIRTRQWLKNNSGA